MSAEVIHVESASDQDGRSLTGVGVPEKDLTATITALEERTSEPVPDRAPNGQFQATKPERPSRGTKRFTELSQEAEAARAEAAQAKRERDELRQQLEAKPKEPPATATTEVEPPAVKKFDKPRPKLTDFSGDEILEDHAEAMARWEREKHEFENPVSAAVDQRIEADRATERFEARKREVSAAGNKAYPDFNAVLVAGNVGPRFKDGQLPLIATLDGSEHILYGLAKLTPAERGEIINLDPVRFGLRIAQFIPARPVGEAASTARPVPQTNAPPPIQPVGSGTRTTSPDLSELAASGNYEAYKAQRRQDLGVNGRR